jgi:cobalt/nickel transport system permease protein
VFYAAMVPMWAVAMNKVKETLQHRHVPLLAMGAAFSFTIMMFNVPVPGGSSVHAVGAVLLAILLGPWAASIGISVALLIQALIFGDGGLLTLGANCFNMAFVMPWIGYGVYRLITGRSGGSGRRLMVAAAAAGYIGICAAALCTAVELGSQYTLFQTGGQPLYFMYPMKVAVVAMMAEHLLLAGPVEGIFTALGLWFIRRNYPELLPGSRSDEGVSLGV